MFTRQLAPRLTSQKLAFSLSMRQLSTLRDPPLGLYAHSKPGSESLLISLSQNPSALPAAEMSNIATSQISSAQDLSHKPDSVTANKDFLKVLHKQMAQHVHKCPTYRVIAQTEGANADFFNIYDLRNPPAQARIAEVEDVIGHVQIGKNGIQEGSYQPNSMYRICTTKGFLQLTDHLNKVVKAACEA